MQMHLSLSLSGWSPVAVQNLSLTLDLGLGLTRCYLTVLSEISVDQMRQKNCETWRSIPRYVHKYVEELYSFAPGWDCFNNFDVITSQQSVLSFCLESLKWTIFLVFSYFSVLRFSLSRIARQAFVICVHLNELQYFIFKRRSQRCLEAFEEVFSLVSSARHSGMTTLKLNFPAICRLWNSNRHKRGLPTHCPCTKPVWPWSCCCSWQPSNRAGKLPNCFTPSLGQAERTVHVFNSFVLKLNQPKCEMLHLQLQHAPAAAAVPFAPLLTMARQEVVIAQLITHKRRLQAELDYCG